MLDAQTAERFAKLALNCVHREYPNKIGHHILTSDRDVRPPRELTPAFYGCYDWHSAVHGHWLLARLARLFPNAGLAASAKSALAKSFTAENLRRETEYMEGDGRASFERPYGLAWLLQLTAELNGWEDTDARAWAMALNPLADVAIRHVTEWLPKLSHPVRTGEHNQSAFSLGLMLDYARAVGRPAFQELIERKSRQFYLGDRCGPIEYEPSGEDFLSPCLGEADVMRRVLNAEEFEGWLSGFLPGIPLDGSTWIEPVGTSDAGDPKLAHLDGLNLSRAWMLRGIAGGLAGGDLRRGSLTKTGDLHAKAGLASVSGERYEGAHWLGTFAVYLVSG